MILPANHSTSMVETFERKPRHDDATSSQMVILQKMAVGLSELRERERPIGLLELEEGVETCDGEHLLYVSRYTLDDNLATLCDGLLTQAEEMAQTA